MAEPLPGCRWVRPLNVAPGHWKKQLPGKYLKLAQRGDTHSVRALLEEQPSYINKRGSHGRTLLWSAVRHGHFKLTQWLLKHGADVNLTGSVNSESFVQLSPFAACKFYCQPEFMDLLTEFGAKEDLFRLTYSGASTTVLRGLDQQPELLFDEDPNDEIYYSPLITFAVVGGRLDLAKEFIERGLDVRRYSFQLLYIAAHFGRKDLLELLFANNAIIDTVDASLWLSTNDLTILRYLISQGLSTNQRRCGDLTPLLYVCRADKGTRVDKLRLVVEHGGDVSAKTKDGRTALHYAVMSGSVKACEFLLDAGVDPDQSTADLPRAVELARQKGFADIVALINKKR